MDHWATQGGADVVAAKYSAEAACKKRGLHCWTNPLLTKTQDRRGSKELNDDLNDVKWAKDAKGIGRV